MNNGIINIAIRAARKAASVILQSLDRLDTVIVNEKEPFDYVSEIDKKAEQVILTTIQQTFPDHSIQSEEAGTLMQNSSYLWIIDPLDGTNNFIHGYPHFAISIAIQIKQQIEHAVIYDPIRNELFTATRGRGAQLNDKRIRVSGRVNLEGALIGTEITLNQKKNVEYYSHIINTPVYQTIGMRRSGSAALDLAYVACGRMDGFWQPQLKSWDVAAGSLLVSEAGGFITDFQGKDNYISTGHVVAANPKIHKQLLSLLPSY